jgi:anaerobic selenocysteine-containing dehydrogenase
MKDVRFTIKKRAFPSQGRVRLNLAHLPELGIREGDHVDLINETTKKTVTATVIADTMVRVGHVRVSEEDLKSIGLNDDDDVLIRKTPPLEEKIKKAAADASKSLSKSVDKLDASVKKTTVDVKASAAKTADTVKKKTKKASDKIGKAAEKTVKEVKKTVKKATGPRDEL